MVGPLANIHNRPIQAFGNYCVRPSSWVVSPCYGGRSILDLNPWWACYCVLSVDDCTTGPSPTLLRSALNDVLSCNCIMDLGGDQSGQYATLRVWLCVLFAMNQFCRSSAPEMSNWWPTRSFGVARDCLIQNLFVESFLLLQQMSVNSEHLKHEEMFNFADFSTNCQTMPRHKSLSGVLSYLLSYACIHKK